MSIIIAGHELVDTGIGTSTSLLSLTSARAPVSSTDAFTDPGQALSQTRTRSQRSAA